MNIEIRLSDNYSNTIYLKLSDELGYKELFLDATQLANLTLRLEAAKELLNEKKFKK